MVKKKKLYPTILACSNRCEFFKKAKVMNSLQAFKVIITIVCCFLFFFFILFSSWICLLCKIYSILLVFMLVGDGCVRAYNFHWAIDIQSIRAALSCVKGQLMKCHRARWNLFEIIQFFSFPFFSFNFFLNFFFNFSFNFFLLKKQVSKSKVKHAWKRRYCHHLCSLHLFYSPF